ncbi:hypothetical protein MMC14_005412 [Varicellaria rhodocarpa]|nr:hypothetical protein [Varicellaria rhodocarpa]
MSSQGPLHLKFDVHLQTVVSINGRQFDLYHNQWREHFFAQSRRSGSAPGDKDLDQKRDAIYYAVALIFQNRGFPANVPTHDSKPSNDYRKWTVKYNQSIVEKTGNDIVREASHLLGRSTYEIERQLLTRVTPTRKYDGQSPSNQPNLVKDEECDWDSGRTGQKEVESSDNVLCFATEIITRDLPCDLFGFQELKEGVDLVEANVGLSMNETCAVIIHIGNGNQGFSVNTIKRFGQLITAFEHVIESIMSIEFLLGRVCRNRARSLSEGNYLNDWNVFRNLQRIEECTDIESIVEVMNPGNNENFAYNFINLRDQGTTMAGEGSARGIELRQCRGTTDILEITSYTHFIGGLLTFAHEAPPQLLMPLCMQYATDPDFTILNLLENTGRNMLIPYYESVLILGARPSTLTLVHGERLLGTLLQYPYGDHPTVESWQRKRKAREKFVRQAKQAGKVVSREECAEWEKMYEMNEYAKTVVDAPEINDYQYT